MATLIPCIGALTYIRRVSDAITLRLVLRVRIIKREREIQPGYEVKAEYLLKSKGPEMKSDDF